MKPYGTLLLVATPIGNLKDITIRAVEALKNSDIIAAEDTRRSGVLLKEYGVDTKMISLHKFNEAQRREQILSMLKEGKNVALISDAGTPGICDPGEDIVRSCMAENIKVSIMPGANALVSALAISGMPSSSFTFHGFSPKRKKEKDGLLKSISNSNYTNIFYESPFRIKDTLKSISEIMPNRDIVLVRELTKLHEETLMGKASVILDIYLQKEPKGEYVVIINGREEAAAPSNVTDMSDAARLACEYIKKGDKKTEAAKKAGAVFGVDRKKLYDFIKNK
jgi:16S rRNA (cytidine1402-2'-O)-methyltransferase